MMRMTVLASGSKGNSTVISSSRTRVLVDAGLSCRELLKRMALAGEDASTLDAILITHEHIDHVAGLAVLARRLRIPVYITEPTHRAWVRMVTPRTTMTYAKWLDHVQREKEARAVAVAEGNLEIAAEAAPESSAADLCDPAPGKPAPVTKSNPAHLPAVEYFHSGTCFSIGDLDITPFTIPHDAADPCGFVFTAEGIRMALATDLGYMPPNVKAALKRIDALLLESNHDLEMLRDGPYPWSVKQRVLSRVGHLSNHATAEFLSTDYDGGAAYIVLGHLSESNNVPELARIAAEQALASHPTLLGNRVLLAIQSAPLAPITL
ncbi:MAG: MBL fold metallo-hydrolase [Acidobacteriales bacterium 59-55]|nr:MBL fold metallo-hydrolase [Terriglobales bacterium]ODU54465.1 MAG: MBL fold metallo-hydrolase [Granulicella sp. SCN 62-9]OJV43006.1 MAG: MBL fold metallo-hydrolase [Acidobacteriales bacterium 59-55]